MHLDYVAMMYKQLGSTSDIPMHVWLNTYKNISHKFLFWVTMLLLFNMFTQFNKLQKNLHITQLIIAVKKS